MSKALQQIGKTGIVMILFLVVIGMAAGAFTDALKLDALFKHLAGKGFSSVSKAYYEESTAFSPSIHGDNVWLDDITNVDVSNATDLVVYHFNVTMVEDLTVSGSKAWYNNTEFPSGGCVPDSYNQSYTVKLYDGDGAQIFLSDAADPFFEYETCRLAFQDTHSFSTPIRITVYTYNGSVLGNGSSIASEGGITMGDVVSGVGNYSADNSSIVHAGDDQRVTSAGENITSGTVADARIASTITRDSEVPSLETDPHYATDNASIVYEGDCSAGQVVMNLTHGGPECVTMSVGGGNPFDQELNTTDDVLFGSLSINNATSTGYLNINDTNFDNDHSIINITASDGVPLFLFFNNIVAGTPTGEWYLYGESSEESIILHSVQTSYFKYGIESEDWGNVTINGENITGGTVADARIASTITRDSEVPSLETDSAHDTYQEILGAWGSQANISSDGLSEAKIDFDTSCALGSYLYVSGNDLACRADPLDTVAEWQTLCTNCVEDGDVVDTLTASNYLPLAGGSLTGNVTSTANVSATAMLSDVVYVGTSCIYTNASDAAIWANPCDYEP